jgi:hypothetical protein
LGAYTAPAGPAHPGKLRANDCTSAPLILPISTHKDIFIWWDTSHWFERQSL